MASVQACSGSIDTDRWYTIRVRCEGPHIQVWLDGEPVIDFTDSPGHLAGKVGIGTWSTKARFRNLKVTSLTGDVLFEGLPHALGQESIAQHWEKVGSGKCLRHVWQRGQQPVQPAHGGNDG